MEEQIEITPQKIDLNQCPVCASGQLEMILKIPQIPVLCNILWDKREAALSAPRGDVQLAFCKNCGHVFNQAFDPTRLIYDQQYENSLHFSPRFQAYANWLAHYLVDQYDLHGKAIVEIGSGKGDFLRMLCEYGGNVGTGFDPSYEPTPGDSHPFMSFVPDVYSERYADYQADLVLSRHVMEHLAQPAEFVRSLRRTIGSRKRTIIFAEVPNLAYILRDTAIWDIIYEHFSYFSPQSLSNLFTRFGFNVLNMSDAFESQFLFVEAIPRDIDRPVPNTPYALPIEVLARQVDDFSARSQEKRSYWRNQIDRLKIDGKRIVVWGAGSKGISLLNMLHVQDEIEYIVDINPRKRNKYVTGAGQQIVPPEFLIDYRPDTIIVMNPIYRQEIENTVNQLGIQAEMLFAS